MRHITSRNDARNVVFQGHATAEEIAAFITEVNDVLGYRIASALLTAPGTVSRRLY